MANCAYKTTLSQVEEMLFLKHRLDVVVTDIMMSQGFKLCSHSDVECPLGVNGSEQPTTNSAMQVSPKPPMSGDPCLNHSTGHKCYLGTDFICGKKPCTIDFGAASA